jgi:hypothetical protein
MAQGMIDYPRAQIEAKLSNRGVKPLQTSTVWRTVSLLLCPLLAVPPQTARAQQAEPVTQLNIVIVEGEGAVNNLRQRVVREPIVRVEDQNHKPVAGAVVFFLLPGDGSGGTFADGAKQLTVMTDSNGQAAARGMQAAKAVGQYQIHVTASLGRLNATATINQSYAAAAATGAAISPKWIAILAVAGGAVAAGLAIGLTRGGGKTETALSPGSATVTAPAARP